MSPARFTWEWIKTHLAIVFGRYVGRWTNVWINVGACVLFSGIALIIERTWARDLWMFTAGSQFGYAFMWLTYPRFSKARQLEMEVEISRIMSESLFRMTRETFGLMTRAEAEEDNNKPPGRLQ
jgi:hypothetical protein